MEKNNMVLVGVLVLMVLVAGVQAFQFNTLSDSLSGLKVSGTVASASAPASAAALAITVISVTFGESFTIRGRVVAFLTALTTL